MHNTSTSRSRDLSLELFYYVDLSIPSAIYHLSRTYQEDQKKEKDNSLLLSILMV